MSLSILQIDTTFFLFYFRFEANFIFVKAQSYENGHQVGEESKTKPKVCMIFSLKSVKDDILQYKQEI